jgi:hypothetical protein
VKVQVRMRRLCLSNGDFVWRFPLTITAVAYASDLHPLAASIEELQKQLNLKNDFLAMHRIKMNVGKTHILINLPSDLAVGQIILGG